VVLVLAVVAAAPPAAAKPSQRSTVSLQRVGAATAGAPVRLRVRARVRRGRVIARHIVSYGRGTRPRHGLRRPRELRHTYARAGRYLVTLTLIDDRGDRAVGRLWVTVGRGRTGSRTPAAAPPVQAQLPPGVVAVPASIPADCSANVQQPLTSFIDAQPDGTTIEFPPGGCYAQDDSIMVREKRDLTIDANGSSFQSSAPNSGARIAGNWLVLRGTNVRLTEMRIVGNFDLGGARSPQRVADATIGPLPNQFNMGVGIYGGSGIHISDTTIEHVFGDGVTIAFAQYLDDSLPNPLDTPSDVHIERVQVTTAARHCVSPSQGDGVWLEDSTLTDCWYGGFDGELDDPAQTLRNLHILRNTFDGFFMFGVAVPVAGFAANTEHVEIRDNTFTSGPDNRCNTTIEIGSYPTNPNTIKDVVVTGNTLGPRSGLGVRFDHVEGGAITGNAGTAYVEGGCRRPGPTPFAQLTNSTGVTVDDNSAP
jgi:hypothetical protein